MRLVSEVRSVCSHAHEVLPVMPLGKWTVPVTVPIGTWFFLPNGSHWKEATSFHLVATSCMVKLTSNFILSASVVTGIFQPISTVMLSSVAEALA